MTRLALLIVVLPIAATAHQPVMDMAPRWEGGYGFQARYESSDRVKALWLEGVYTYKRELRFTAKLPVISDAMQPAWQLSDSVIGVQLKSYYNRASSTGNFGLTPSLRLPTAQSRHPDQPGWDPGISLSFSAETRLFFQFYDLFYWHYRGAAKGDELGLDINWGYHPYHHNERNYGIFLMLDIAARDQAKGSGIGFVAGRRIAVGLIVVPYRENVMARLGFRVPIYEHGGIPGQRHSLTLDLGIGATF